MGFDLFCMTLISLLFGLALVFAGYRMLWIFLPIWGFFFGFGLGAQTLQVWFGVGFLSTITSWVVGFLTGAMVSVFSYLFYIAAVGALAGSLGYALGVGLLTAFGLNFGFLVWLVGVVLGVVVAAVVLIFDIQKYAVITITAIDGAAAIIYTLLASSGGLSPLELLLNPVQLAIQNSFWWFLFFVVVAGGGILVQLRASRAYEIEAYNRYAEW